MKKMIEQSEMTRTGVEKGDLRLIGAMYDIYTGDIEWMGVRSPDPILWTLGCQARSLPPLWLPLIYPPP